MIRILLLVPQILLNAHFQALLSQSHDLAIVGMESDRDRAIECARWLKPDVVIAAAGGDADSREMTLDPIVLEILKEGLAPVVIVLDAAEHRLRLYCSEAWQVHDAEDLEQAIRAEPVIG